MLSTPRLFALALSTAPLTLTAPVTELTPPSLNLPSNLTAPTSSTDSANCPSAGNSCGVVTFASGQYVSFGEAMCMQLGKNIKSIYVGHCYCSLWNVCTGYSHKDVFVDGMMMCEKPRLITEFDKEVRYVSCGGLRSG